MLDKNVALPKQEALPVMVVSILLLELLTEQQRSISVH